MEHVQLPLDSTIASPKLTRYLLKFQQSDDKSKFLQQAGYTLDNWQTLETDIRAQILSMPATFLESGRFGDSYEIRGTLTGPNGVSLNVVTIWMTEYETRITKFITLFPNKEANR